MYNGRPLADQNLKVISPDRTTVILMTILFNVEISNLFKEHLNFHLNILLECSELRINGTP